MTYEDSNYFCFCFYSESNLYENKDARLTLDNSLIQLLQKLNETDLKQRALNRVGEFKIETIRKVNLKPNPINSIFEKVNQSLSLTIYIHDNKWTDENAPNLIINLYCSNMVEFNGRNILENPKMFFIAAISHELISKDSISVEEAENIFKINHGINGGIWKNTKYTLNDGTPIAWAYQNYPGNNTNSSLQDWNPNFDYRFVKNKS